MRIATTWLSQLLHAGPSLSLSLIRSCSAHHYPAFDPSRRVRENLSIQETEAKRIKNRYSSGRGARLYLKRAEKARILVAKIPENFSLTLQWKGSWSKFNLELGQDFCILGDNLVKISTLIAMERELEQVQWKGS